jgi:pimeloyl-ACP methyl ester carboxylesterase
MSKSPPRLPPGSPDDLRGLHSLWTHGTHGLIDLIEAMHARIAFGDTGAHRTRGITGLVYNGVRGINQAVSHGLHLALRQMAPTTLGPEPTRSAVIAALNGVLGDHLTETGNPLAIPMTLVHQGQPVEPQRSALADAVSAPGGKVLVLIHGLCMNDQGWLRNGHDHGAALAEAMGYTPLYLRYNTGQHISINGRTLADLLDRLLAEWPVPVESLTLLCHSMGGLVARSACHYGLVANHQWPSQLKAAILLATPHHGAPAERAGNLVDAILSASSYSAPLSRLGKIRSAGITDLRHGNIVDEDWQGRSRFSVQLEDPRTIVPLPETIAWFAMAATRKKEVAPDSWFSGDGIVPLASALGDHRDERRSLNIPPERRWVGCEMNHFDLLDHPEAFAQIKRWLRSLEPGED